MKNKIINWSIKIFAICFVVYGFIYHTFVMFMIIFIIIGIGYGIVKYGQKLFKLLQDIKKP
jgi:hypothetical protein